MGKIVVVRFFFCQVIYTMWSAKKHQAVLMHATLESKGAKIKNCYNQVPHLTLDTNGQVTNSQ